MIAFVSPLVAWLIAMLFGKKITYTLLEQDVEKHTREKQNSLRRFSDDSVQALERERDDLLKKLEDLERDMNTISILLATEQQKIDGFSIDTSLFEKVVL